MKKLSLISAAVLAYCILPAAFCFSQGTAINSTGAKADSSAMLDVSSTTKGMLVPRMLKAEKLAISNPANGLLIYQTDDTTGFWYFNSVKWVQAVGPAGAAGATGNTGPAGSSNNKRMFVTSTTGTGNIATWANSGGTGGVTGADNVCGARAAAAGLSGTYKAFICTSTANAVSRITTPNLTYVNVKGDLLSTNSFADVSENSSAWLYRAVLYTEFGVKISGESYNVMTGCNEFGKTWINQSCPLKGGTCNDWTYSGNTNDCCCTPCNVNYCGIFGTSGNSGDRAFGYQTGDDCNVNRRLYCFEE